MDKLAVVAVGGNALIEDPDHPTIEHQWATVRKTARYLVDMIEDGWALVITHGNGPQVGFALRRSELAADEVHPLPLDVTVASTQGTIGYMLQQSLGNELCRRRIEQPVVSLVTQTQVASDDPAFDDPSKPIGRFLTERQAEGFRHEGWCVVEDAGRGLRRVVASPEPQHIIEYAAIETMVKAGYVVIAGGGGGIPVTGMPAYGVNAVIDKDRTAAVLASALHADLLLISTAVEQVAIHFKQPNQTWLSTLTIDEAQTYLEAGHFSRGSMAPKIEACIRFIEAGGPKAIITNPAHMMDAVKGQTGTTFVPLALSEVAHPSEGTIE